MHLNFLKTNSIFTRIAPFRCMEHEDFYIEIIIVGRRLLLRRRKRFYIILVYRGKKFSEMKEQYLRMTRRGSGLFDESIKMNVSMVETKVVKKVASFRHEKIQNSNRNTGQEAKTPVFQDLVCREQRLQG